MLRARRLIALGALSMAALACGESSRTIQAAQAGQAGDQAAASAGEAAGGAPTEAGKRAKFRVIDPVQDHALQSGEQPVDFERSTSVSRFSSDAAVVVGISEFRRLGDAPQHAGREALRWTETSGVVGLGFAPGLDMTNPRALFSTPFCVSLDGSTVAGTSEDGSTAYSDVFLWTEASGMTNLGKVTGASRIALSAGSSDCSVLVGTITDDQLHRVAVRWSASSGWQTIGGLPGGSDSESLYVSADGASVIGVSQTASSFLGYRWTEDTGVASLGQLPGAQSCTPRAMTPDARVIVGDCSTGTVSQTFRWTEEAGMVSLGSVPGAGGSFIRAISTDGAVVIGQFYDAGSTDQAFRWTEATGMVDLGVLAGYKQTSLTQLNADGTMLLGEASDGSKTTPVRWTEATGLIALAPLPGDETPFTGGMSGDGTVVAGLSGRRDSTGSSWAVANAVVWDDHGVAHSIAEDLTGAGVDLNGFHLDVAFVAPIAGQSVLFGQGKGPDGSRAWVAWLP